MCDYIEDMLAIAYGALQDIAHMNDSNASKWAEEALAQIDEIRQAEDD